MACLQNSTIFLLLALAGFHHWHYAKASVRSERPTLDLNSNAGGLEPLNNPAELPRNGPSLSLANPTLLRLLYENWSLREQIPGDFNAARSASLDRILPSRVMLLDSQGNDINYPGYRIWVPPKDSFDDEATPLSFKRFEPKQSAAQLSLEPSIIQTPEIDWEDIGHDILSASKRDSYMSMCHFKICNLGRKRRIPHMVSPTWPA